MLGQVRHDDFQSYKLVNGSRYEERTAGFYAVSTTAAIAAALIYVRFNQTVVYVAGHHRHSLTSSCNLPEVTRQRWDFLRTRANTIIWSDYHLFIKNCQHWAKEVAKGA